MKEMKNIIRLVVIEKKDIFLSVLFGFIAGIASVALFGISGFMISKAALSPPIYILTIMTASLKLFGIGAALSKYAERYFSHRATFTILSNIRVSFYEKLEPLAPGIFRKYRSGDLLSRIVGDVETLQNFFLRVFYPPIVLVLVFLSTIFFTTFYSIYVSIALLVGLLLTGLVTPALFAWRQKRIDTHVREQRGLLSTEVTEFLHGFRDLKIYQRLQQKEQQLLVASDEYVMESERKSLNEALGHSINQFVGLLITLVVLAIGAYEVVNGQLDGVFLAMLVMISLTLFENTSAMAALPSHLEDSRQAATRLYSVVGDAPKKEEADQTLTNQRAVNIEMENVSFSFPNEVRLTVNNISLSIPADSKTAIIGPSGSGKSTLLQLLLKIFPGNNGSITLDGMAIEQLTQESIWSATNVVLQENHFFYGTIRENLLIAKEEVSDEEMADVLRKVQLDHFSLEDNVLEKGENLSGGEKQRLAIARAMLKGMHTWLLDEPTSSLDALTEQTIYQHLFEQAKNDTVILVSHRLSGLEKMDQIIVMDRGTIIESGSFDELMERKGYFYEMKQIEKSVFM